jgi:excisionase family DNA binding protein
VGLTDFVKGQFVEIIEWVDNSRDTLVWRFPDEDKEIKRGAQLVVRESQVAQLVYLGQFADLFQAGTHTLSTANIPLLTRLRGWKYGFESPFKADVYFISTRVFTGNQWGTANPFMVHDEQLGVLRLRAFGTYDFHIVDASRFLHDVSGTDDHFQLDGFADVMRSRIVSVFSEAVSTSKVPAADIATRFRELGDALLPLVNPILNARYGLELTSFVVENISVPPEVEQAIDRRSGMSAVGDLNDFIKYQLAEGLATSGGGVAGLGAQMAVGAAVAQQVAAPPAQAIPETLSPLEAAKLLGVTEADVVASLQSGDLKGRKIGSAWRVTRAELAEFLK